MSNKCARCVQWSAFGALLAFLVVEGISLWHRPHYERALCGWLKDPAPKLLAHRGSRFVAPENTLVAFRAAQSFGADVLEFDVRLTADDQLVIFHDDDVDRTTNGTGSVRSKTLAEMKTLDAAYQYFIKDPKGDIVFPERGKGNQVITLSEFFEEFPDELVNIEVKEADLLATHLLEKELKRHPGIEKRAVVVSKYCQGIHYLRERGQFCTAACEEEAVMYTVLNTLSLYSLWYSFVQRPIPDVFQIPVEAEGLRLDAQESIETTHLFSQKIHYWVINDEKTMKELLLKGADGIITDRVDIAVDVFKALGIKKSTSKVLSTYYPQDDIPVEIHNCDGLLCLILSAVFNLQKWQVLSAVLGTLAIVAFNKRKQKTM